MSAIKIDCAYVDQHDVATLYLGRKLSESEAADFEAHYMGCEKCWNAIEQVGEIRRAGNRLFLERPAVPRRDLLAPLAAAAVVAVLAIGLNHLFESPGEQPSRSRLFRSSATSGFEITVTYSSKTQFVLEWPPHPKARSYVVEIFRPDGVPILRTETPENTLALDLGNFAGLPSGTNCAAKVFAVGAMGQRLAVSSPKAFPIP